MTAPDPQRAARALRGAAAGVLAGTAASDALTAGPLARLPGLSLFAFEGGRVLLIVAAVVGIAFLAGTLPAVRAARTVGGHDRSVQVHRCHGPARQVEVLREVLLGLLAAVSNDDPLGRLAGVLGTVGGVAMLLTGAVGHRRAVADAQRSTSLQEIDEPLWDSRSAGQ